jgi:hypothetical protein
VGAPAWQLPKPRAPAHGPCPSARLLAPTRPVACPAGNALGATLVHELACFQPDTRAEAPNSSRMYSGALPGERAPRRRGTAVLLFVSIDALGGLGPRLGAQLPHRRR